MESINDEGMVCSLAKALNQQLNESSERISKLQAAAKKLVSPQDYDRLASTPVEIPQDVELDEIQLLEDERMRLVMRLQKQDYIAEKLTEMVDSNQEILDSVHDYLLSETRADSFETENTQRLAKYAKHTVKPTKEELQNTIGEARLSAEQALDMVDALTEENITDEYKEKVAELVRLLRKAYARIEENTNK